MDLGEQLMNLIITTREADLNLGIYNYLPDDCIPNRMPYLAQQLLIDFIEGQDLPLRLVNTNHIAILYDDLLVQKIAVIYLNIKQQLIVETFPGMEFDQRLQGFLANVERRFAPSAHEGIH
jgi:hypothetical protein